MSKILEKLRNDPRIEHVSDERACGNSIIVTMKGFTNDPVTACHTFGEDNPSKALTYLGTCQPCHCQECTGPPPI